MVETLRISKRQGSALVAAAILLLATIVPALVSAAQITTRSIEPSSSSKDASGVSYKVDFTAIGAAGAVVVEFCNDSPLLGATCTAPSGFDVDAATIGGGFTKDATETVANKFVATGTISAGATTFTLSGVHNPTAAGPLYARIVTYTDGTGAAGYESATPGTHIDDGGIAMDITDSVGVSAAVLETMTFCVAGAAITTAGCGGTLTAPTLVLGETVGSVKALTSSAISTGDIYTQLSTNAAGGVVVNLKSNVACGGLKRVEAAGCDIAPALQTNIAANEAKFGVKVNADSATDTALSATGTYQIFTGSGYHATNYALNYLANNSTGVTSVYGDPILETNSTQPSNKNMKLTFGASISNNTPAGMYKGDLSLIATGKF